MCLPTSQEGKLPPVEVRCPDPSGNPYLQLAVMLMAGIDGIKENCELPAPMELNLYDLTPKERIEKGIEALPGSLEEAIKHAENSSLIKETLGSHSFERFMSLKKMECEEYRLQVTDWEIKKYYPIL